MSYPGGKNGAGVYQTIINRMPPHSVYLEPFLGGGAILRLKQPAALNIGIDLDSAVIARMREWARLSGSRRVKNSDGPRQRILSPKPAMHDRQFRFLCQDGIAFLESYPFTGDELVYCDPPYMHDARKSLYLYKFEMTTQQHLELLDACWKLPCKVMISGYWTGLYAQVLRKWNSIQFEAMTRGGHTNTEYVWSNFPAPAALHDYSFLGSNFREREKIKRKKLRWVNRLKRMPTLEKQCLLEAIATLAGNGDSAGGLAENVGGRRG